MASMEKWLGAFELLPPASRIFAATMFFVGCVTTLGWVFFLGYYAAWLWGS